MPSKPRDEGEGGVGSVAHGMTMNLYVAQTRALLAARFSKQAIPNGW
jgi:hypothetical protein